MDPVYTEDLESGMRISIFHDEGPLNPREDGHLGTMACFHSRYNLGDKLPIEAGTPQDFLDYCYEDLGFRPAKDAVSYDDMIARISKKAIILPLYLYDHGGTTISLNKFACKWDSGQVGWIWATHQAIRDFYTLKKLTKVALAKALTMLQGEVEAYDEYLTGEVYGYTLTNTLGDEVDSCWGFSGYDSNPDKWYVVESARESAMWLQRCVVSSVGTKVS